MTERIYLDHHATTPVDARVLEQMLPYFAERFGNPASGHAYGWDAAEAVERARGEVAAAVGVTPKEILFTSGATESNNLAMRGALTSLAPRGRRHLVVSAIEHAAVLDVARRLEREGFALSVVPVGDTGVIDPSRVAQCLRDDTAMVSVMTANNEIGTVQPIAEIASLAHDRGALFHTDAAQAIGRVPFDASAVGADLVSLSAHKMYGPKGVGALVVRKRSPRTRLEPLMDGGGQEQGLRPGTLNVPAIIGFGRAAVIAVAEREAESLRVGALRDRLLAGLTSRLDGVHVNGELGRRLPGNLNASFSRVEGESLITSLKNIALSSGSACAASARKEPSHVLRAIGLTPELAHQALRFGIGRFNTAAEIDFVIEAVVRSVTRLRELSPLRDLERQLGDLKRGSS